MKLNISNYEINWICNHLRILAEEFGASNIVVAVPLSWKGLNDSNFIGPVALEFSTARHLLIRVAHSGGVVEYKYAVA